MEEDQVYLTHTSQCLARIEEYVEDSEDSFTTYTLVQDAVLRNLVILSECSKRLTDVLKGEHPEVDWSRVAGFRESLIEGYPHIDLEFVWEVIQHELPNLKKKVDAILAELKAEAQRKGVTIDGKETRGLGFGGGNV